MTIREHGAGAAGGVFELRAGSFTGRDLDVVELRGREGVSRLWRFDVRAVTRAPLPEVVAALLGRPAELVLRVGATTRTFTGVVCAVTPGGVADDGAVALGVRLVPRMWLLRRRSGSRIFQDLSVREIVGAVLAGLDVPCAFHLSGAAAPKAYCVQYQETDFDFVTRLLGEEGIAYRFEPAPEGGDSDVVVFSDDAHHPPLGGGPLFGRPPDGLRAPEDTVGGFEVRRAVRSEAVMLRDFDPHRPRLDPTALAERDRRAGAASALRVYDHAGHYQGPEVDAERAKVVLEQLRRRAVEARGEGRTPRIAAGRRFALAEHPLDEHDREWLVTRVDHRGRAPERLSGAGGGAAEVYRNTFTCVPAEEAHRPPRPRPVARQVLETATVVGPAGEEIHTDSQGRIKVQFHWDLDGGRGAASSCWVPVSQAWAGPGWGFQFVPRIGMEVLVSFLGGDVDKPVVTGCLATPVAPPPHPLPAHATRSGIRTRSVPGPEGHNELSFEDRRGHEEVRVHAERDLAVVVRRDHTTTVGSDHRTRVAGAQELAVDGRRDVRIGADLEERIDGSRSERIRGGFARRVDGWAAEDFGAGLARRVAAGEHERIDGSAVREVGGDARLQVGRDLVESVRGSASLSVEGDVGRAVQGAYAVATGGGLTLTSSEAIRLVCGASVLELGPREITLSGPLVTVHAAQSATVAGPRASLHVEGKRAEIRADEVRVHGKGAEITLADSAVTAAGKQTVTVVSAGASLVLDQEASLDGATVKLNCAGDSGGDFAEPDEGEESYVDVSLTHPMPRPGDPTALEHRPVPGARFVVEASDGRRFRGVLDGQGRARVPVPKGPTRVSFPDYDAGRVKPA